MSSQVSQLVGAYPGVTETRARDIFFSAESGDAHALRPGSRVALPSPSVQTATASPGLRHDVIEHREAREHRRGHVDEDEWKMD